MKLLALFYFAFVGLSICSPYPKSFADPKEIAARFEGSIHIRALISQDLRTDQDIFSSNIYDLPDLKKIFEKYDKRRKADQVAVGALKGNNYLIKTTLQLGLGSRPGGAIISNVLGKGLDIQTKWIEEKLKTSAQKALGHMMLKYRKQTNDILFKNFQGASPSKVFRIINGYSSPAYNQSMEDLSDEARGIVNMTMIKIVQDTVVLGKIDDLIVNGSQDQDISSNGKKLAKLSEGLWSLQVRVKDDLERIYRAQSKLEESVNQIDTRVSKNFYNIKELKNEMYGVRILVLKGMSPKDKLKTFKNGLLPKTLLTDRAYAQLEMEADHQVLMESVGKFVGNLGHIANIAQNLENEFGLPKELVEVTSDAARIGGAIFSATTMWSQNPLASISAISNLFGGGGNSNAGVMKGLNHLMRGQKRILESISQLGRGQRQILGNQDQIFTLVTHIAKKQETIYSSLSQRIAKLQSISIKRFDRLEAMFGFTQQMIRDLAMQDFRNCFELVNGLRRAEEIARSGRNSYTGVRNYFNSLPFSTSACFSGIIQRTSMGGSVDSIFLTQGYAAKNITQDGFALHDGLEFQNKIFFPAMVLLKLDAEKSSTGLLSYYCKLLDISGDYAELVKKLSKKCFENRAQSNEMTFDTDMSLGLFDKLLFSFPILNYFPNILELVPYIDYLTPDQSSLYSVSEILSEEFQTKKQSKLILNRLSTIIGVAIVQESIISGDLLLPIVLKHLLRRESQYHILTKDLLKSAGAESILVKNLVQYIVSNGLVRYPGSGLAGYDQGYYSDTSALLQSLIGGNNIAIRKINNTYFDNFWGIEYHSGWIIEIQGVRFQLPEPESFTKGVFEHRKHVRMLLELRQQVKLMKLDGNFVNEELDPKQIRILNSHLKRLQ